MRFLPIATVLSTVALCATTALGQFGLYGSPEMLRLPPSPPVAVPYAGPQAPMVYPVSQVAQTVPLPPNPSEGPASPAVAPPAPAPMGSAPEVLPVPGSARAPSLVDQMLAESDTGVSGEYSGCGPVGCGDYGCGDYGSCGSDACSTPCFCCPWYGSLKALVLARNSPNKVWTSYEDGDETNQVYDTGRLGKEWQWGGEITFGRRFCVDCDCSYWALEATYWTLNPLEEAGRVTIPGGYVSTTWNMTEVEFYDDGAGSWESADVWFMGSEEHRLWRHNEVHSVELSLLRDPMGIRCATWGLDWSMGVRFFRFNEELTFGALRFDGDPATPADWGYFSDHITNSLVGFQAGADLRWDIVPTLQLTAGPKLGIYNNHIRNWFYGYLGDGSVATTGGSGVPGNYPVASHEDVLAFLAQVDLGLEWKFAPQWSATIGYRVVAVTGIGLADDQFPQYTVDIPEIKDLEHNGNLILHGAYWGLTYSY